MNGLALCAGVGGLELGAQLALGDDYRTVCYVEREAYAAATLVARMEDSSLDPAPIWDDLTTFDGRPWRGKVDLVTAGFPCQPFSHAGKRRGTADDRWLWDDIARILGEVRPGLVFLENVRGILAPSQRDAIAAVLGTLADLGFDAEWGVFSAAEVGAPHKQRERFFLLGYTDQQGLARWGEPIGEGANEWPAWPPGPEVGPDEWPRDVPQPAVRRGADGMAHRVDRLRACGNGVVPLQAAYALRTLAARIGWEAVTCAA